MRNTANGFGAELALLLREKKMSVSALARGMGLKSKTVVFRMLNDECLYATAAEFLEKMKTCVPPVFAEGDFVRLDRALEVTRLGVDVYHINRSFRQMLDRNVEQEDGKLAVEGIDGVEDIGQLMEIYAQARRLKITLLGSSGPRILQEICRLIRRRSEENTVVEHFFAYDKDRSDIVNAVADVKPVLFSRAYRVWAASDEEANFCSWLFRNETLYCRWTDADDVEHFHQLVKVGEDYAVGCAFRDPESIDFMERLIGRQREHMQPFKREFGNGLGGAAIDYLAGDEKMMNTFFDEYIQYTADNLALESGRNIYNIKPDITLAFVAPELAKAALLDGLRVLGVEEGEALRRGVEKLLRIQEKRFDNIFTGRKVFNSICNRQKMVDFARTGRTTDHFFGMRSYTPKERVRILSFLMEQTRMNPYFNIYFAKAGTLSHDLEIGCYEGVGTLMLRSDTSYDLGRDHAEVMIRDRAFSDHFVEYYRTQLLAHEVEDVQETIDIFRHLIGVAKVSG